jgi:hypothetical protein
LLDGRNKPAQTRPRAADQTSPQQITSGKPETPAMRPSKPRTAQPRNQPPAPDDDELDEAALRKLEDDLRDALALDDDYEPLPDYGDFWTDE